MDEALAEMEAGKREAALVLLLEAWRKTNAPAIADVIDALGASLTEHEPPIRAVGSISAKKAWTQTVELGRSASLGRLLEVLPDGLDRCLRLRRLLEMDRDPRITAFAIQWMQSAPVHGPRRAPFFTLVVEMLEKTKDVRILPKLNELTQNRGGTIHRMGLKTWKPLLALIDALGRVIPRELTEMETKTLEAIHVLVAKAWPKLGVTTTGGDPKQLFAKVYANPEDDEARVVLSDLLQQQGDPRGEFIALQLARFGGGGSKDKPRTSRERELIETWERQWLGAIEPAIMKSDVVFERGFVARCRYAGYAGGNAAIEEADEWSTVTHLDVSAVSKYRGGGSHTLLSRPAMRRSLRHVLGVSGDDVRKLNYAGPFAWETLGMRIWDWRNSINEDGTPVVSREAFPSIKKLFLEPSYGVVISDASVARITALLDLWPSLEELDIALSEDRIAALSVAQAVKRLLKLTIRAKCESTYEIDLRAKEVRASFGTLQWDWGLTVANVVQALGEAKCIERFVLSAPGRVRIQDDELRRGRYDRMLLTPIRAAAERAAITLDVVV